MSRFFIFLLVVLAILGGVHFYFWVRLVRDTQLPVPYRAWASGALIALALSVPAVFILGRRLPVAWSRLLVWPAYTWIGVMLLLLVSVVALDLLRLGAAAGSRILQFEPWLLDPERRTFLARVLGAVAGLSAGGLGGFALSRGLAPLEVKRLEVTLDRLPAASHGTTIVQLTDVHIGPTIGRAFAEELVRKTNALAPDVIAITGDLVDGSVEALWDSIAPLRDLRARFGVYFVTGNHEYFSGARSWMEALPGLGIRVLHNQRVPIGEDDGGFDLAGVDDWSAAGYGRGHGPDLPKALEGRDPSRELVLLAHQPRAVVEAARLGVGLQLSGHTHGGQIWPFVYLVKLQQPYIVGLHRHEGAQIYVSPGTGYWGPPMRLGTRAEITHITLLSTASRPA